MRYFPLLTLALLLVACEPTEPTVKPSSGDNSSMIILPPYAEPCLDWHADYKSLLNNMAQRGFTTSRITDRALYYNYLTGSSLLETAVLYLDEDQNYHAAEVTIHSLTVSSSDVEKFLSQQYVKTGSTPYPTPETFYRSKVSEDSIHVSLRMHEGRPLVTYTKQ